jgi:hypothetical protein
VGDSDDLFVVIDDEPHITPAVQHTPPLLRRTVEPLRFELATQCLIWHNADQ